MTTRSLTSSLTGLKQPRRGTFSIVQKKPKKSLVSAAGIGLPTSPMAGGSGGVLEASTFTVYSSDGLFSFTFVPRG